MYPTYRFPFHGLGPDDAAGLRALYPGHAAFTLDAQTGIDGQGRATVAYPDSVPLAFNLRAHGAQCDPAAMWLQLEQPGTARYLTGPTFNPQNGRLSMTRAPNDPYVCYARVWLRPTSQDDPSPGFIRFNPMAPEGHLYGAQPSFTAVFARPRLASRFIAPNNVIVVPTGGTRRVKVSVLNAGTTPWTHAKDNLHFVDASGHDIPTYPYCGQVPEWHNGNAVFMDQTNVAQGETATYQVKVCGASGYTGTATLRLQSVAEADSHFGPVFPMALQFGPGG